MPDVPAHVQKESHSYYVAFPEHPARADDPHYKDFEEYRKRTKDTAACLLAYTNDCGGGLELHHAHIEFSLQNGVDLSWLERDYPGVSDSANIGAWVESAQNLVWYCERHHRGLGGVHNATSSDFEAEKYVKGLIQETKED